MVIWFTGLSGAGKTTYAKHLIQAVHKFKPSSCFQVDGDIIREIVDDKTTSYDRESRIKNAYRICRFAKEVEKQGYIAVVSTMSLFHEIHDWNRKNFDQYVEVLIEADLETLAKRNSKNIYKPEQGNSGHVVGKDIQPEFPRSPDFRFFNSYNDADIDGNLKVVLEYIKGSL